MNFYQKRLAALPILILTAGLVLSACTSIPSLLAQPMPTPLPPIIEAGVLTVEGWMMPVRSTALGFVASGELGEILVTEGQAAHKGDVLASLGERKTLEATLSQAKLEQLSAQQAIDDLKENSDLIRTQSAQALVTAQKALMDAQKTLNHLDTGKFQEELDDRNDAIQDAQDELDDAQEKLDKHKDLDPEDITRKDAQEEYDDAEIVYQDAVYDRDSWQNQLDQARAAVDTAQARLDDAQRMYDAHQNGLDPDDLALAQARLDNANSQVAAAQNALSKVELTAPYDSTVVDVNDLEPGEYIVPGNQVVMLADYSKWIVETRDLTELDVVEVEVGQKVTVTPDALPDLNLAGVVESIDLVPTERSGEILYTVHIRMDEVDPLLRWGMTVSVTFE